MYYLVFCKRFTSPVFEHYEYEWTLSAGKNKDFQIALARKYNERCIMDITMEHFKVYESETKTWNKKKSKLIYPTAEYPLLH